MGKTALPRSDLNVRVAGASPTPTGHAARCDPHLHRALLLPAGPASGWGWADLPRRSAHVMQPGPDVLDCTPNIVQTRL